MIRTRYGFRRCKYGTAKARLLVHDIAIYINIKIYFRCVLWGLCITRLFSLFVTQQVYQLIINGLELNMPPTDSTTQKSARALLSKSEAIAIFLMKYTSDGFSSQTAKSVVLSAEYGVSAKTVRDIWCGRSWLGATHDHWQAVLIEFQKSQIT